MVLSVILSKQPKYYNIVKKPANMILTDNSIVQSFDDHRRTNDDINLSKILNERGFDFTEDEMKKLKLWSRGVIPYYIDVHSFADKVLRDRIRWFLNELGSITSLNFVELPRPPIDFDGLRWVFFVNRRGLLGCADHSVRNFTNTGVQQVVLGYDCINSGGGLPDAILAVVGVPAQHNAPNRDDYIEILHENIIPEKLYLYEKLKDDEWLFHDLIYDFASAGHVSYHRHSAGGRATFKSKAPNENTYNIGNHHGFSYNDILKITRLYNYITMKTNVKESKCSKLFLPGKKNYDPKSTFNDFVQPRQKPNKYLGIYIESYKSKGKSEKSKQVSDTNYKNNISENDLELDNRKKDEADFQNNEHLERSNERNKINYSDNSEEVQDSVNSMKSNNSERVPKALLSQDPLTILSDYASSEENKNILWKTIG